MAASPADLALWDAVRDGDISRAKAALAMGADINRPVGVTVDASTGAWAWDLFHGAHLPWRHPLAAFFDGSPCLQPPTRGVATSAVCAAALPCEGDRYLHIGVKVALTLSSR